jgi:hypothetical protein
VRTILLVLGIWAIAGTAAVAADLGPSCLPILKAMTKTLQSDHSTVTQDGSHTSTGITAGGANYLQMQGKWIVSPLSPQDNLKRSEENLRNAKVYTCQALPDSVIDGVPVANYRTRTESANGVVDSTVSIAKGSGLAIRVENSMDSGGGAKASYVTRYGYTGIHAPAVQK